MEAQRRPDLRLAERRLRRQQFARPGLFHLSRSLSRTRQHRADGPGGALYRAPAGHRSDRSRRLGIPHRRALRPRLPVHDGQRLLQPAVARKNRENGFDLPMAYFDLYIPQVAEGMNIRVGRYISLPDIEAQLAPNNYTYSHSLTYTFDCYTQTGINVTTKLSNHFLVQAGLSPGCDVAPWQTKDRKLTFNTCLGYTWREGLDNIYVCDNTLNDG